MSYYNNSIANGLVHCIYLVIVTNISSISMRFIEQRLPQRNVFFRS